MFVVCALKCFGKNVELRTYFSSILIDPKVGFDFVEVEEKLPDAFDFIGSIL